MPLSPSLVTRTFHWLSLAALVLAGCLGGVAQAEQLGESSDFEIAGVGDQPGQFLGLMDMVFDVKSRLYALDGARYWDGHENKEKVGNCRVQVFGADGAFLTAFSVKLTDSPDKDRSTRLAVDGRCHVFVTQPEAGVVVEYAPPAGFAEGKGDVKAAWTVAHSYPVADAFAIAAGKIDGKERVLVLPRKNEKEPVAQVVVLDPTAMTVIDPITLERSLNDVQDLAIDAQGCFYAVAWCNQVFKFDSKGKNVLTIGAGTYRRTEDGSELQHTVALDSKGNIYGLTPGNPGSVARFTPDMSSVTLRPGEFKWADAWGPHSNYLIFAIDGNDRLWVGSTGICVNNPPKEGHHTRPCILRPKKDFLATGTTTSTKLLGLDAQIAVKDLDYNLAYELKPIQADYVLKPAIRRAKDFTLDWFVYDIDKNVIAKGSAPLPAEDGKEARQAIAFTPPAFGWYEIEGHLKDKAGFLIGVGEHVGVTPKFPGLPEIAKGESTGNWCDSVRFGFTGLKLMRTNTNMDKPFIEKCIEGAAKYHLTLLLQLENREHCEDAKVREAVTACKGRVKYYEIINEPNLGMSAADYCALLKRVVPIIKEIDPAAQVMGPAVCGIDLGYIEAVFKDAGGLLDVVSLHDYEGNEAIDPGHWRWKYGEVRRLMAKYQLKAKEIWQTERAISGVRFSCFMGGVQAVRITLHRDLLDTLGVPNEHNSHYYMNDVGYAQVPTYLFGKNGPFPAALALRTRHAMVLDRTYKESLSFGPDGDKVFMGLRFAGADGETVILRQLGTALPAPITMGVKGGDALTVVDSFGNATEAPVKAGQVALTVPALPLYLRLKPGQTVTAPRLDYGPNFAKDATFTYSSTTKSAFDILTNGILEATHGGSPVDIPYWTGKFEGPQTLDIELPIARRVNRVAIYAMRADNPHCDLLDFDLQYHDGKDWKTLKQIRTPCPPSQFIRTAGCAANTWYMDQNLAIVEFPAVATSKLRIVALKTTWGAHPDELATIANGWKANAPTLCLREIEVTGEQPVALKLAAATTEVFKRGPIAVTAEVANLKPGKYAGTLKPVLPPGWTAEPAAPPFALDGLGAKASVALNLTPGATTAAGTVRLRIDAVGQDGKAADSATIPIKLIPATEIELLGNQRQPDGKLYLRVKVYPKVAEDLKGTLTMKIAIGDQILTQEQPIDLPTGKKENEYAFIPDATQTEGKTITVAFTAHVEDRFDASLVRPLSSVPLRFLGPFPNEGGHQGFDVAYPPEQAIDLAKTYDTVDGKAPWKKGETRMDGYFDLREQFKTKENVCAYAVTFLNSAADQEAILSCGSDDGIKTWVNGVVAISDDASRGAAPGQESAKIKLKKGWNPVLLKITQGGGGWGLFLQVMDANGQALTNIRFADEPK